MTQTIDTDTRSVFSLAIVLAKVWPVLAIIFSAGIVWGMIRATTCDIDVMRRDVATMQEEIAVLKANAVFTKEKLAEVSADVKLLLQRSARRD